MPTTRSSAGSQPPQEQVNSSLREASFKIDNLQSPRYQTRSLSDSNALQAKSSPSHQQKQKEEERSFKFPFFDDRNTSISRDYDSFFSPEKSSQRSLVNPFSPVLDSSEAELSPIAKERGSDVTCLEAPMLETGITSPVITPNFSERSHEEKKSVTTNGECGSVTVMEEVVVEQSENQSEAFDLRTFREQVGQSSNNFIERIRNAAHRRKVAMTRSRDSLAAKEEEQLRSIAETKRRADEIASHKQRQDTKPLPAQTTKVATTVKGFKARPLPPTTGALGSGGLDGVPKVEKKTTTTPFSPLLGARRPKSKRVKALQIPKKEIFQPTQGLAEKSQIPAVSHPKPTEPRVQPFKARPVPKELRSASGQHGIPKVEKRPLTQAMSPLLGPRRRSRSTSARTVTVMEEVVVEQSENQSEAFDPSTFREQVGQSSSDFVERIRNAAHRHKVAMTRSRDSLAAKEEEQLRSIAETKRRADEIASHKQRQDTKPLPAQTTKVATTVKGFKARPLPPTTGALGSGGLHGVPKVEKKTTTTPFSPLLGARRPKSKRVKALQIPKKEIFQPTQGLAEKSQIPAVSHPKPTEPRVQPFKARPVPKELRSASGQHGIPKVKKRPLTQAMSPLLGPRRRSRSTIARLPTLTQTGRPLRASTNSRNSQLSLSSRSTYCSQPLTADSPLLLGLKIVGTPKELVSASGTNDENTTPTSSQSRGYEPHSTRRAKKRAEYEVRRKTMFELKAAREMQEREQQVKSLQRELCILRNEI